MTYTWVAPLSKAVKAEGEALDLIAKAQDRIKAEAGYVVEGSPALAADLEAKVVTTNDAAVMVGMPKASVEAAKKLGLMLTATAEEYDADAHAALMGDVWHAIKVKGQKHLPIKVVREIVKAQPETITALAALVSAAIDGSEKAASKKDKPAPKPKTEPKDSDTVENVIEMLSNAIEQAEGKADEYTVEQAALIAALADRLTTLALGIMPSVEEPATADV